MRPTIAIAVTINGVQVFGLAIEADNANLCASAARSAIPSYASALDKGIAEAVERIEREAAEERNKAE